MYYVLFTYSKGHKERDFRRFRNEIDLIRFIHKNYEKIDIVQIIWADRNFRLGLIEAEESIKSELVLDDDKDPFPEGKTEEEVRRETEPGAPEEEKSAMEKIGDDIEEEMTDEEKTDAALERGDKAIAAAEKDLAKKPEKLIINPAEKPAPWPYKMKEVDRTNWRICPECKKNQMAPWNKSDRCSECQQYKKIPKKK